MGYECVKCGTVKKEGSKVYFINNFETMLPEPTCSRMCYENKKIFNINRLTARIEAFKETGPIEEIW